MKSYDLGDLKFLLIDPNGLGRNLMRTILRGLGARDIIMAESGELGLDILRKSTPDIVFSTWHMPNMDGLEFTQCVRAAKSTHQATIPIIIMSAQSEAHHVILARDSGVTEFLAKPLSVKSVYSRICAIIERPRDFIKTDSYFGPDRRRHSNRKYNGVQRRESDRIAAAAALDQAELETKAREEGRALAAAKAAEAKALAEEQAKAAEAARIAAEAEAKPAAPVDPSAMSQEELAKMLDKKEADQDHADT
jgi:two-component system, chemotaxis family, chemotaxis protein CheY